MTDGRAIFILGVVVLMARPVAAQELEAFDLSDFLDPELLVYETDGGEEVRDAFVWSRLLLGFLDGYQRRDLVNESGTGYRFARLANSFHFGRYQANLEILGMDRLGLEDDQITDVRAQLGKYFYTGDPATGDELPARMMISWRSAGPERLGFENELSLSIEVATDLEKLSGGLAPSAVDYLFGSYVYTYQPEREDHYLSYASRATLKRWDGGSRIRLGGAFGAERVSGHTRVGPTRLELSFVGPLPLFNSSIHISYAASYRPHPTAGNDHFGYELGVFTDIPLGSKVLAIGSAAP